MIHPMPARNINNHHRTHRSTGTLRSVLGVEPFWIVDHLRPCIVQVQGSGTPATPRQLPEGCCPMGHHCGFPHNTMKPARGVHRRLQRDDLHQKRPAGARPTAGVPAQAEPALYLDDSGERLRENFRRRIKTQCVLHTAC